jgi:hypothetical protein
MVGLRNGCMSTAITKLFMSCHAPFKVGRVNGLAAKSCFAALVREVDTKVLRATRVRDRQWVGWVFTMVVSALAVFWWLRSLLLLVVRGPGSPAAFVSVTLIVMRK